MNGNMKTALTALTDALAELPAEDILFTWFRSGRLVGELHELLEQRHPLKLGEMDRVYENQKWAPRARSGERGKQQPKPPPLRPACEPALSPRSPALAVRRYFRHFVTAITGGGWVLCEVKALSMERGQSNGYDRFDYCRRDRIRRLVGLYGYAVEAWEGGCVCGVGSDLTACDYVALASRRNTGRILTE